MLTFKRALLLAATIITVIYLLSHSHSHSDTTAPIDTKVGSADRKAGSSSTHASTPNSLQQQAKHQKTLQSLSKMTLLDKLAYQFPYDLEAKFPAYIWQTWKHTPASSEFDENFRAAEASWSELNPGFIHEVITDQVAVHLMTHLYASIPEVLEAYNSLPLPILKADFFRYLILLARGGIYTDIDTTALQSALDWIPAEVPHAAIGLVIGIEADPDRPDWAEWYSRRIQFCQWTIQSKPGHPVLREIVAQITRETLRRKAAGTLSTTDDNVVEFTGPAVWTDIIFSFFNNPKYFDTAHSTGNITFEKFTGMTIPKKVGDVVVLPITCFSPGVQQMGAEDYDSPMAYVRHEFEGTWKPDHLRHIGVDVEGEKRMAEEEAARVKQEEDAAAAAKAS